MVLKLFSIVESLFMETLMRSATNSSNDGFLSTLEYPSQPCKTFPLVAYGFS